MRSHILGGGRSGIDVAKTAQEAFILIDGQIVYNVTSPQSSTHRTFVPSFYRTIE